MPALVANHQKQTFVTGLKKNYSIFAQATQQIVMENPVTAWNMTDGSVAVVQEIYEYYKPYLNIIRDCGCKAGSPETACWSKDRTKALNGQTYYRGYIGAIGQDICAARLSDGTNITFDIWNAASSPLGTGSGNIVMIHVDVNGDKGPNTMGRDVFILTLSKDKNALVAAGVDSGSPRCVLSNTTNTAGVDCAAKVLFGNGMDY
jgi:hypothetical protein